jgi:hypothetical protein
VQGALAIRMRQLGVMSALLLGRLLNSSAAADDIDLRLVPDPERITRINCQISIQGKLSPFAGKANQTLDLMSSGRFEFLQRQLKPQNPGASGLRAVRRYEVARSATTVNKDYRTDVQLPAAHRLLHLYGSDSSLVHVSPTVRLARKHVDLLQLPCDPLVVTRMLPTRLLSTPDEKWNADAWVLPLMVGLEGVVSQEISCQATAVTNDEATVEFLGKAEGAVAGAAVTASVNGQLTIDRKLGLIRTFKATMKQQRTPGVVSPGLDVTVEVTWSQEPAAAEVELPQTMPMDLPDSSRQLLTLATPWRLTLLHHRDWHVFHETSELLMLRQLQHGALIGQCNIAAAQTEAPGKFTSKEQYIADVQQSLLSRGGKVISSDVRSTDAGWRIHHVRANTKIMPPGNPEGESDQQPRQETVVWDYYLCTWKTGEQFTLIFTYTESDQDAFGDSAEEILQTLAVRQDRPKLRLPR